MTAPASSLAGFTIWRRRRPATRRHRALCARAGHQWRGTGWLRVGDGPWQSAWWCGRCTATTGPDLGAVYRTSLSPTEPT